MTKRLARLSMPGVIVVTALTVLVAGCSGGTNLPRIGVAQADSKPLPNFTTIQQTEKKKEAFFSYLLPIVHACNAHVLKVRQAALAMQGKTLTQAQQQWLSELANYYRIKPAPDDGQAFWQAVKQHVDIVPPSLALAQAANESGWGTSRFARQGNNLFGEWCYKQGCGIVPKHRASGATHEVRTFASVAASVSSYIHNINTNHAYARLRAIRTRLRQDNKPISGLTLAQGLDKYSERGQAYVESISAMIRSNDLAQYDGRDSKAASTS